MDVRIESYNGTTYVVSQSSNAFIRRVDDLLDILAFGGEHETNLLLLEETNFSPAFYDLGSGMAGKVVQKFSNYRVLAVIVGSFESVRSQRFREFMAEANKGNHLQFAEDRESALAWLIP